MRDGISRAGVTYRGNRASGGEVELRLAIAPEFATLSNAWRRLSETYGKIDPYSLEIEIRH